MNSGLRDAAFPKARDYIAQMKFKPPPRFFARLSRAGRNWLAKNAYRTHVSAAARGGRREGSFAR
jgi:hypothetical protein